MSGKKTKKLALSQNCFKQFEVELYVDKTIRQHTNVKTRPVTKLDIRVGEEFSERGPNFLNYFQ